MKWEQPLEAATFSQRDFFPQNTQLSGAATSFLKVRLGNKNHLLDTFSTQLLFRRSCFSRISNIHNMYFFEAGTTNSEHLLFRSRNFLKTVTFSEKLVQRKHLHSIYTWKDFPLNSMHFFKYSMVRSDFEIPQPFIVESSEQHINFNCVTNMSFWEPGSNFGIFKQTSKNSPYHLWFKRCCNENLLKIVENWAARHFWRAEVKCHMQNEILESSIFL